MAKKSKKASGTSARRGPAAKKKVAKKVASKKTPKPAGPGRITPGKGASAQELGQKLVELFNQNKADAWIQGVWSNDVESIEGSGEVSRGKREILGKWDWWTGIHEVLGANAEGPYVGATGFAVKLNMHVREKASGREMRMSEVAVYSVRNGRIYREEFMYSM